MKCVLKRNKQCGILLQVFVHKMMTWGRLWSDFVSLNFMISNDITIINMDSTMESILVMAINNKSIVYQKDQGKINLKYTNK